MSTEYKLHLVEHPLFWVNLNTIKNMCGTGQAALVKIYQEEGFVFMAAYLETSVRGAIVRLNKIQTAFEKNAEDRKARVQSGERARVDALKKQRIASRKLLPKKSFAGIDNLNKKSVAVTTETDELLRDVGALSHHTMIMLKLVNDIMFVLNVEKVLVDDIPVDIEYFSRDERVWSYIARRVYLECLNHGVFKLYTQFWESHFSDINDSVAALLFRSSASVRAVVAKRVEEFVLVYGRGNFSQKPKISFEKVKGVVTEAYCVTTAQIDGGSRTSNITKPRLIAYYLSRKLISPVRNTASGEMSLPEIGRNFGGRDHTTVLHGIRKVKKRMKNDCAFAQEVNELETRLVA